MPHLSGQLGVGLRQAVQRFADDLELSLNTLALAGLAILLFRGIDPPEAATLPRLRVGPGALLLRAGVATALVLVITTLAGHIGETWAGFLSGFPVTLYPVLLIAHLSYSERAAHGIIKGFPLGIGSLVVCAFAASFLLVPMGVYWGMLAAILVAGLYLAAVALVVLRRARPAVTADPA
ncbi:hypothetical protein ACFOGJ_06230 [Marinibaculum pumilum]|uniref:DUF3147 family protein n=1 Tax=Marinibaculum pumilum TaxID=1766165 RepID=A0ABV7KWP0_9PROT